jgi:hypothetical protein
VGESSFRLAINLGKETPSLCHSLPVLAQVKLKLFLKSKLKEKNMEPSTQEVLAVIVREFRGMKAEIRDMKAEIGRAKQQEISEVEGQARALLAEYLERVKAKIDDKLEVPEKPRTLDSDDSTDRKIKNMMLKMLDGMIDTVSQDDGENSEEEEMDEEEEAEEEEE